MSDEERPGGSGEDWDRLISRWIERVWAAGRESQRLGSKEGRTVEETEEMSRLASVVDEAKDVLRSALMDRLRRSTPDGEREPVAWAVVNEAGGADKLTVLRESAEIWLAEHEDEHPDRGWSIVPLYADHPAPDSEDDGE